MAGSLAEIAPFFGDSAGMQKAGLQFAYLNYLGMEYERPLVDDSSNPNILTTEPLYQLLLADNHVKTSKNSRVSNYLSGDVLSFFDNVGRYHKGTDFNKLKDLYKKWDELTPEARRFLQSMVTVKPVTTGGSLVGGLQADNEIKAAVASGNFKIELTKDKNGESVFSRTIPLVPDTVLGYTGESDTPKKFGKDARDILRVVYKSGDASMASSYVPVELRGGSVDTEGFNLDYAAFVRNYKKALTTPVRSSKVTSDKPASGDCDDLNMYDMASNVFYGTDESGKLFRMENGSRVYPSLEESWANNCLGKSGSCTEVADCLLSGNPSSLSRCLDKLKDSSMFDVAQSELNKMHPTVVVALLRTFGFKPMKHSDGSWMPMSYDEWKEKVLPKAVSEPVKAAIMANTKLQNYLRSLVTLVRQNPVIFEEGEVRTKVGSYAARAERKPFVQPVFTSTKSTPVVSQGVLLSGPVPMFNVPLASQIQNVTSVLPGLSGLMGLRGGAEPCVNAELLRRTFNTLFSQMERNGKVLVEEDKTKVENAINRVAKLENELTRLMDDVKVYSRLNNVFSVGRPVPVQSVRLDSIKSDVEGKRGDVAGALGSLTETSNRTLSQITNLVNELVTKVVPALNAIMIGRTSPYVVPL